VPLLPWEPAEQTIRYSARQIMSSRVKVLCHREKVGKIFDILLTTTHNGFPVVKESSVPNKSRQRTYGQFLGIILRSQLIILLRNKVFEPDGHNGEQSIEKRHGLGTIDFQDMYPRYPSIHTINVTQVERGCYMNLVPFMNCGAYTAYLGSSFPHIFKLFRGLGLRHLAIVDEHNQVVGIVTRRDLARYRVGHGQKGMVYKLRVLDDHVD
jgi:chloride channel 7